MRLLTVANPGNVGFTTDDGFEVGRVTAAGTLQLVAACVQIAMLGGAVYLLVRPLLIGSPRLRLVAATLGGGTAVGGFVVRSEGFDFGAFNPDLLPVALFVLIPMATAAVFVGLAERWLAGDSWFMSRPWERVAPALLAWLVGAAALVVVLPMLILALGVRVLVDARPPHRGLRRTVLVAGRVGLVLIFLVAVVDLTRDVVALV